MKSSLLELIEALCVKSDTPAPAAKALQEIATLDRHIAALRELQSGTHIKTYNRSTTEGRKNNLSSHAGEKQ